MITLNTDPRIGEAILAHVRENPHDSTHRKIYGDWLEENGRDDEALHHRVIAHLMDRRIAGAIAYSEMEARPHYTFPEGNPSVEFHEPFASIRARYRPRTITNPLYTYRRQKTGERSNPMSDKYYRMTRRPSTPLEASRAATKAGMGLLTLRNFPSALQARDAGLQAEGFARGGMDMLTYQEMSSRTQSYRARDLHGEAAYHHLQAATELETRGTGGRRFALARLHRRAALAHLYAAYVHDKHLERLDNQ